MTNREIISNARNMLKSVNIDDRLPSAFIYSEIIKVAQLIFKREAESRKIFNSTELFKKIECEELIDVESKKCGNLPIPCKNLKRSKNKIPKLFLSSTGSIMFVTSVVDSERLTQSNVNDYINISKREFKSKSSFYWVEDDYLWIPNTSLKFVNIYGIPLSVADLSGGCNFLDSESSIPGWMLEDVLRVTIEKIANINKRLPADENSNLNEHQKQ